MSNFLFTLIIMFLACFIALEYSISTVDAYRIAPLSAIITFYLSNGFSNSQILKFVFQVEELLIDGKLWTVSDCSVASLINCSQPI